jgi:hypothetical protein
VIAGTDKNRPPRGWSFLCSLLSHLKAIQADGVTARLECQAYDGSGNIAIAICSRVGDNRVSEQSR